MKNTTKVKLLKTRGIIKKVCVWTPLITSIAGMALGIGLFVGGATKVSKAVSEFKQSPVYEEVYNQQYEEIKSDYDNGKLTVLQLNEKMEEINNSDFPRQVLDNAGDEAKEYKAMLKTGINYEFAAIPGVVLAFGGVFLLLPWFIGPEIASKCEESGNRDLSRASSLYWLGERDKKKQQLEQLSEGQGEDEEELPNIEDSYYKE